MLLSKLKRRNLSLLKSLRRFRKQQYIILSKKKEQKDVMIYLILLTMSALNDQCLDMHSYLLFD